MPHRHAKNTVRYYLIVILLLGFLFFSNDFGLIDTQKTAIVMSAGIDKEGDEFLLTAQIAIPKSSDQGEASEAVAIVTRGKTVAEAFEAVNAKTGWYPKLVFCRLILLGESAKESNVFDALDFFLRDEYFSDDCQVAVCAGKAQEILEKSALVDPSSSVAIGKVLSPHAERAGTVLPCNLKDFAIGYFGESRSGRLPIIKMEKQKDNGQSGQGSGSDDSPVSSSGGSEKGGKAQSEEEKPVFSARETALFVGGRWLETLTAEESFAVNAVVGKLRLASFTTDTASGSCALNIKRNLPKIGLKVGKAGDGALHIQVKMIAGAIDFSKAQSLNETKDMGNPPDGAFAAAEKKLQAALTTAFEKAKGVNCDLFGLQERLVKYKSRDLRVYKDTLLPNTTLTVKAVFTGVR